MVGGLDQLELVKSSSMILKNQLGNHYYNNPYIRGVIYRGQLKSMVIDCLNYVKLGGYAIFKNN